MNIPNPQNPLLSPQLPLQGLDNETASARLLAEGFNELPATRRRRLAGVVLDVIREPMMLLLLGGGLLYLLLGDLAEALILLLLGSASVSITIVQEGRTERALDKLRDMSSPKALVLRGGVRVRIEGRNVVRGDLVILEEGCRVPADGRIIACQDLQIDESLLTGESVPVSKTVGSGKTADNQLVFSGTLTVRGTATVEITTIGAATRIGAIGRSLNALTPAPSRLQTEMRRLVRVFGGVAALVCLVAVILYGLIYGNWLNGLLGGIALAMSMLPEEFPVVLTVFTAMGAWRISKAGVLTRRPAVIEALGGATVLCTDKTGTLTENRMSVVELWTPDSGLWRAPATAESIDEPQREMALYGMLASQRLPFDPMEQAFHALSEGFSVTETTQNWQLQHTYGLTPDLLAMSQIWQTDDSIAKNVVAAKGAPEAVMHLCRLPADQRARILQQVDEMAARGLRILAIARAHCESGERPSTQGDFHFTFLGLAGLADPLRPSVPAAIAACQGAGIQVVMITGDYPATACAIARQAGLPAEQVITGDELREMTDAALAERVRMVSLFARIRPEDKLRLVQAFRQNGNIVAMTGDGVNDAPSLKAADIGIAMGKRGTDVAREAAALVLLDDDFGSIITAIGLGRRIHDNLRKAMCFIVAVHVPIAGLAIMPLVLGMPVLLGPVHIALLELVIDPVCSLVFENEPEEPNILTRAPGGRKANLLSLPLIAWGLFQGLGAFMLVALLFIWGPHIGMSEAETRGSVFTGLVLTLISLTLVNRSFNASLLEAVRTPNRALMIVLGAIGMTLVVGFAWPVARSMLKFSMLSPLDFGLAAGAALAFLVFFEVLKPLWRKALTT